jgi:phosphoglycolate phosphatase
MHLFFDLDGTLTDSSPGIVRCINHALVTLGHEELRDDRLRPMIGTPLASIFADVLRCDDACTIDTAVEHFRHRFDRLGMFENSVFPGILEALEALQRAGHTMQVVTAKPKVVAERVLDHFALTPYFAAVHGPELDTRTCDKADFVAAALTVANGTRASAVMIGDRVDDIRAAHRNGVRAVAVGWGYGTHEELLGAEPHYFAATVAHLLVWVGAAHAREASLAGRHPKGARG